MIKQVEDIECLGLIAVIIAMERATMVAQIDTDYPVVFD
ncbi:hypothetical protein JCM19236_5301 [Vibrio sp. JCM 19236]|nr:hypothetical protein JCM19236_5301 [Vibrio sp. JCM 19236]